LARLDRLSATREVAQIGAAIGTEFDYQLLDAVADLPQVRLHDALSQLEAAALVFRRAARPRRSTPSSTRWCRTLHTRVC